MLIFFEKYSSRKNSKRGGNKMEINITKKENQNENSFSFKISPFFLIAISMIIESIISAIVFL